MWVFKMALCCWGSNTLIWLQSSPAEALIEDWDWPRSIRQHFRTKCVSSQYCKYCDYPTKIPTTTQITRKHTGNCCNGQNNGQYDNTDDLHSFYGCADGIDYVHRCHEMCSSEKTAIAVIIQNTITKTTKTTRTHTGYFCNGYSKEQYPNPDDTHSLYSCADKKA